MTVLFSWCLTSIVLCIFWILAARKRFSFILCAVFSEDSFSAVQKAVDLTKSYLLVLRLSPVLLRVCSESSLSLVFGRGFPVFPPNWLRFQIKVFIPFLIDFLHNEKDTGSTSVLLQVLPAPFVTGIAYLFLLLVFGCLCQRLGVRSFVSLFPFVCFCHHQAAFVSAASVVQYGVWRYRQLCSYTWGLLWLPVVLVPCEFLRGFFHRSVKWHLNFDRYCVKSVGLFW